LLDPYGRIKVVDLCLLCPYVAVGGQGNSADSLDPSLGGPAQKTPNFQMAPTPKKTFQNC
jgi:hypothetical protein